MLQGLFELSSLKVAKIWGMKNQSSQAALKPITLTSSQHFLFRSWAKLYRSRFPRQELAPLSTIAKAVDSKQSYISGLLTQDNQWVGFAVIESYGKDALLAYLATAPNFEGMGLARTLVEQALDNCLSESSPYFFLEAAPKLWDFYQKLGFYRLPFDYAIPDFYGQGVSKMGLFIQLDESAESISKERLYHFVSDLLLEGYQLKACDQRYGQQMAKIDSISCESFKVGVDHAE